MKIQIRNEWLKIRKQKKSKVFFILTMAAVLMLCIGNFYVNSVTGFMMVDGDRMPISMIGVLSGLLFPLVAYIMAVDSMSAEVTSGTIKYAMMAPISRNKVFFSKLAALSIYNCILLGGVFILGFVLNVFVMNGNILMNFISGLAAYVITMIPMTLIALWGLFIGMHFTSGLSLGIGIIGIIGLNIGQLFLPILGTVSPVEYMDLYSQVIFGNTSLISIVSVLLYVASYYIILIALNLLRINQKEI